MQRGMNRLNPFFRPMKNAVQLSERHLPVNGVPFASSPLPLGSEKGRSSGAQSRRQCGNCIR